MSENDFIMLNETDTDILFSEELMYLNETQLSLNLTKLEDDIDPCRMDLPTIRILILCTIILELIKIGYGFHKFLKRRCKQRVIQPNENAKKTSTTDFTPDCSVASIKKQITKKRLSLPYTKPSDQIQMENLQNKTSPKIKLNNNVNSKVQIDNEIQLNVKELGQITHPLTAEGKPLHESIKESKHEHMPPEEVLDQNDVIILYDLENYEGDGDTNFDWNIEEKLKSGSYGSYSKVKQNDINNVTGDKANQNQEKSDDPVEIKYSKTNEEAYLCKIGILPSMRFPQSLPASNVLKYSKHFVASQIPSSHDDTAVKSTNTKPIDKINTTKKGSIKNTKTDNVEFVDDILVVETETYQTNNEYNLNSMSSLIEPNESAQTCSKEKSHKVSIKHSIQEKRCYTTDMDLISVQSNYTQAQSVNTQALSVNSKALSVNTKAVTLNTQPADITADGDTIHINYFFSSFQNIVIALKIAKIAMIDTLKQIIIRTSTISLLFSIALLVSLFGYAKDTSYLVLLLKRLGVYFFPIFWLQMDDNVIIFIQGKLKKLKRRLIGLDYSE